VGLSLLKKNVVANFASNGWTALIGVALIPIYIKFLGIEAWGLIGIFASLQTICLLLDLGLSTTLNREMARLSAGENNAQEMRNLVRTLELISWAVAAVIGVSIFALAHLIVNHWLQASHLSPETITQAIRVMGVVIALQWPFGLYSGGLLGLQRQVLLSAINIVIATLRGAGVVLVLWKVSPTVQAFLFWQVVISIMQTCLVAWFLWRRLPDSQGGPSFQSKLLRATWRFAAGLSGTTVLSVILTQMDKIILSRVLSLEIFGYYVLAGAATTCIYLLVLPVYSAIYPRFTQLISLGDEAELKQLYHHGCQLMSVLILPVSIVMAFFSREILFLWTGNATTADNTHSIFSILVIGTALNGLMHLPHALQLASGWTKLAFYLNLAAILICAPLIILMVTFYGAVGAAITWVIINCSFVLVGIQLMHRRLLKGEQWRWYFEDVGLPLAVSLGTALLCLLIMPKGGARIQLLTFLAGTGLFVAGSTFLAVPVTREILIDYFRSWRSRVFNAS
jgi:O-antigen/teichoic acid export membrane protein